MDRLESEQIIERNTIAYYDVSDCIRSWGRRGILGGGLVGFALGAALATIPNTANVLTFGVIGTLIIGVVEGAVIAGAFGAFAAALFSKGVVRDKASLPVGRWRAKPDWREGDIPSSD